MLLMARLTGSTVPFTRPKPGFGTQEPGVLEPGGATVLMGHGKHSTWVPPWEYVSAGHLCSMQQAAVKQQISHLHVPHWRFVNID
jgi:hypothetical protein